MNDPNGLIFENELYHLYFQYYNRGMYVETNGKGINWGHATSPDMIRWNFEGVAIPAHYPKYSIFSGSTVLKDNVIYAFYTADFNRTLEDQRLSTSVDNGYSFQEFEDNPILSIPGENDFRDPKVTTYSFNSTYSYYVMSVVLAREHQVVFYKSDDLVDWIELSRFNREGRFNISEDIEWECPNLFPVVTTDHQQQDIWMLVISTSPKRDVRFFLGSFDGISFLPNASLPSAMNRSTPHHGLLDYGPDFYATQLFDNTGNDRHIMQTWMMNWGYSKNSPSTPWSGGPQNIPREVILKDDFHVFQQPVQEIETLRLSKQVFQDINISSSSNRTFFLPFMANQIEMLFSGIQQQLQHKWSLSLHEFIEEGKDNEDNQQKTLINVENRRITIDRSKSGETSFSKEFEQIDSSFYYIQLAEDEELENLRILVDWSSIELFVNNGKYTMSVVVFPKKNGKTFSIISKLGELWIDYIDVYQMDSIH